MSRTALAISVCTLIFLAAIARADSIPIGQLSYLGTTPNGASIFKVSLDPPPGISLGGLVPTIYIGDDKLTFVLPTSGDFLFLTGPGTPFANCPCIDAHIDFRAMPGTVVTFAGQTWILKNLSHSFLRPLTDQKYLLPQQSTTIYLSVTAGKADASSTTPVPEPAALSLMAIGAGIIFLKIRVRLRGDGVSA